MYILLWIIVITFGIFGFLDRKSDKILFNIEFLLMMLALTFRYGQGTDYFGYSMDYLDIPSRIDLNYLFHNDNHGEIGFLLLCEIFKSLKCPFVIFGSIFAVFTMILFYIGIYKISEYKTIALILFFPTYYHTFCYSAIRQGLVIAIVLSITIPAYLNNNKVKYIISVIIGSLFHSSVLSLLVVPLFLRIFIRNKKLFLMLSSVLGVSVGIILYMFGIKHGHYIYYSPSIAAIIIRLFMLMILTRMYNVSGKKDKYINAMYNYYCLGMCIFFSLSAMAFLSNRMTVYFKECEIILVPMMLSNLRKRNIHPYLSWTVCRRVVCCLLLVCLVETGKNMESYVRQGGYNEDIHFYNYPYVSMFDKSNIFEYRKTLYDNYDIEVFGDVF